MDKPALPTEAAIDRVLFCLYLNHQGPWRVESDWMVEVWSPNGLVAKCRTRDEAESLIRWRDEYAEYMLAIEAEVDAIDETEEPTP